MVTSVSSLPYFSYLGQLQGKASDTKNSPTPVIANNTDGASPSLVSSLLGKGGFAPSVLSLLQENGGNFDPIATILGGKSVNNGLTKLYANLYDSNAAANLQKVKLDNPKALASASASFGFINDAVKASTAYNQILQQNAAIAVAQSKTRTDAITSVIS